MACVSALGRISAAPVPRFGQMAPTNKHSRSTGPLAGMTACPFWPRCEPVCSSASVAPHPETTFRSAYFPASGLCGRQARRGSFFEDLDYPTILPGVLRAAGDIEESEFSHVIGDPALGTLNIEPFCNNLDHLRVCGCPDVLGNTYNCRCRKCVDCCGVGRNGVRTSPPSLIDFDRTTMSSCSCSGSTERFRWDVRSG